MDSMQAEVRDIRGLVKHIEYCREMYLAPGDGIVLLERYLLGYERALGAHGILEACPRFNRHFSAWLQLTRGWSVSSGWARAIEHNTAPEGDPVAAFFSLANDYMRLKPRPMAEADLHVSADQHYRYALVKYEPMPMYFLVEHRGERADVLDILRDSTGHAGLTLKTALELGALRIGIPSGSWLMRTTSPWREA